MSNLHKDGEMIIGIAMEDIKKGELMELNPADIPNARIFKSRFEEVKNEYIIPEQS